MDENEKKLFRLEMEKELRKSVEEDLKRRYTWIGTIVAVVFAFLGTGSYMLIVNNQLAETKHSLETKSDEALRKLGVAEALQKKATEKIDKAVDESEKLANKTAKLKDELTEQVKLVKQDLEKAQSVAKNVSKVVEDSLSGSKLIADQVTDLRKAMKLVAESSSSVNPEINISLESAEALDSSIQTSLGKAVSRSARSMIGVFLDLEFYKTSDLREKLLELGYAVSSFGSGDTNILPNTITLECGMKVPALYSQEIISLLQREKFIIKHIISWPLGDDEEEDINIIATKERQHENIKSPTAEEWNKLLAKDIEQQEFFDLIKSFER